MSTIKHKNILFAGTAKTCKYFEKNQGPLQWSTANNTIKNKIFYRLLILFQLQFLLRAIQVLGDIVILTNNKLSITNFLEETRIFAMAWQEAASWSAISA